MNIVKEMFSLFYGLWKYVFSKTEFHVLILGIDKAGKIEMSKSDSDNGDSSNEEEPTLTPNVISYWSIVGLMRHVNSDANKNQVHLYGLKLTGFEFGLRVFYGPYLFLVGVVMVHERHPCIYLTILRFLVEWCGQWGWYEQKKLAKIP